LATAALVFAFVAMGAGEWVREDLRKPYVIGNYMFVNGVRVAPAWAAGDGGLPREADRFALSSVRRTGLLQASLWPHLAPAHAGDDAAQRFEAEGREVFRLACSQCHSIDGYLAIRPLVAGRQQEALATMIGRFTAGDQAPADTGTLWTWRGRRMPPFAGSDAERDALAGYLAGLGGSPPHLPAPPGAASGGSPAAAYFTENCSPCHGEGADFPIGGRGRTAAELYEMLGRLSEVNEAMPAFEGSDELRKALADYLAALPPARQEGGAR
jgi:mono/diheme cytochrome c family protein